MKNDHPKINFGKTGVLLINLGTPDSTKWWDIRKYLKEFLSDKRVIEVNPVIWQIILNLFILTFRPSKTARAYKEIWFNDVNKSPLRFFTEMQTKKLSQRMKNEDIIVDFAMRYGNPSIKMKIEKMQKEGCEKLIILPLYPQYASPTTATVCDEVFRVLMKMRWQPAIQIVPHYEKEWIALEIIKTNNVDQKDMFLVGRVKNFSGYVTALQQEYEDCKICGDVILYCKCHEDVIKDIEGK